MHQTLCRAYRGPDIGPLSSWSMLTTKKKRTPLVQARKQEACSWQKLPLTHQHHGRGHSVVGNILLRKKLEKNRKLVFHRLYLNPPPPKSLHNTSFLHCNERRPCVHFRSEGRGKTKSWYFRPFFISLPLEWGLKQTTMHVALSLVPA